MPTHYDGAYTIGCELQTIIFCVTFIIQDANLFTTFASFLRFYSFLRA